MHILLKIKMTYNIKDINAYFIENKMTHKIKDMNAYFIENKK